MTSLSIPSGRGPPWASTCRLAKQSGKFRSRRDLAPEHDPVALPGESRGAGRSDADHFDLAPHARRHSIDFTSPASMRHLLKTCPRTAKIAMVIVYGPAPADHALYRPVGGGYSHPSVSRHEPGVRPAFSRSRRSREVLGMSTTSSRRVHHRQEDVHPDGLGIAEANPQIHGSD